MIIIIITTRAIIVCSIGCLCRSRFNTTSPTCTDCCEGQWRLTKMKLLILFGVLFHHRILSSLLIFIYLYYGIILDFEDVETEPEANESCWVTGSFIKLPLAGIITLKMGGGGMLSNPYAGRALRKDAIGLFEPLPSAEQAALCPIYAPFAALWLQMAPGCVFIASCATFRARLSGKSEAQWSSSDNTTLWLSAPARIEHLLPRTDIFHVFILNVFILKALIQMINQYLIY